MWRTLPLLLLLSCTDAGSRSGTACELDRDCPTAEICRQGRCIFASTDAGRDVSLRLDGGADAARDLGVGECRETTDCFRGEVCVEGVCMSDAGVQPDMNECSRDRDCFRGEVCVEGMCVSDAGVPDVTPPDATRDAEPDRVIDAEPDRVIDAEPDRAIDAMPDRAIDMMLVVVDAEPDQALDAEPDRGIDAEPDRAVDAEPEQAIDAELDQAIDAEPDQAIDAEPDMAPPLLGYGQPCEAEAECASSICVNDPAIVGGLCSVGCARHSDCPVDDVCLLAENGGGVCFRNETGDACRNAGDCIDGICLTPPDPQVAWVIPQPICVNRCGPGDDKCPHGFECGVVQSDRGPVQACRPRVTRIDPCQGTIDECVAANTCAIPQGRDPFDIAACVNIDGEGYCSCTCGSAADCPAGFACVDFQPGDRPPDPQRPGLCMPMAGYRCPVNILGGGDQCPSLVCLPDGPDPGDAYCSGQCVDHLDCPPDYACRDLDGQGTFVCMPAP